MDPRQCGASCDTCPLNAKRKLPVHSQANKRLVIINDVPHQADDDSVYALRIDQYRTVRNIAHEYGVDSTHIGSTSAVACPGLHLLTQANKKKAIKACAPRLEWELSRAPKGATFISIGEQSYKALQGPGTIEKYFGTPSRAPTGQRWMPVLDATTPQRGPLMASLIRRGFAFENGSLPEWKWPPIHTGLDELTVGRIRGMIGKDPVATDVETTGNSSRESEMWCIGFANSNYAISVPWPTTPEVKQAVIDLLTSDTPKIFQNGQFDANVLRAHGLPLNAFDYDTLCMHTVIAPELPHGLDFIASVEFPVEHWKSEYKDNRKLDWANLTDQDRIDGMVYNARDCVVTRRLYDVFLKHLAKIPNGWEIFQDYMKVQRITTKMTWHGALVDMDVRAKYLDEFPVKISALADKFREFVPEEEFTLGANGSHPSIKKLIFDKYGIKPLSFTKLGAPQCDVSLLTDIAELPGQHQETAQTILRYRKATKLYTTYIRDLPIGLDGHIRSSWNGTGARTGRWSSSRPNLQNFPRAMLRDMICAPPGKYIVEADFSALELRIAALVCHAPKLLRMFADNIDVHGANASKVFKTDTPTKGQRTAAKFVAFGSIYNASPDCTTMYKQIRKDFPTVTYEMVEFVRRWFLFKEHHEIRQWQLKQIDFGRSEGYVEEVLSGRRRHFFGKPDDNKALNFPIQGFAATITNRAIENVDSMINWDNEQILFQIHDAIYLVGNDPYRLRDVLKKGMTQTIELDGDVITFTVDCKVGTNWGNLQEFSKWEKQLNQVNHEK